MEKFIYSTFNEYPEDFENKADAARLETIGYISKMTPFALYCIKDLVKWPTCGTQKSRFPRMP